MTDQEIVENLTSRYWRLNNLYWVLNEKMERVHFQFNPIQEQYHAARTLWDLILKARQHGFTTYKCLYYLDSALWVPNTHYGIIAHNLEDASHIFKTKVRYPYDQLDPRVRTIAEKTTDNALELSLSNGSLLRVGSSLRSGTYKGILVSEFGKICARYPERAREIVTGAFPTIHEGGMLTVESTAEGREGYFFDFCKEAQDRDREGIKPGPQQFKFHFYAWWKHPNYTVDPTRVTISAEKAQYFNALRKIGIALTDGQKAWYVLTEEKLREDMKREYPSTPEEAFEASVIGAYFAADMAWMRENDRITSVPWDPTHPVNTAWDLGLDDCNFILWHQKIDNQHRIIDCYEQTDEGMGHYATELKDRGYSYLCHYLPHDVDNRIPGEVVETRKTILERLGVRPIRKVERIKSKPDIIQPIRDFLRKCWIDKERCGKLIDALDGYRREWDDLNGRFKDRPVHDWTSHRIDAFDTLVRGWAPEPEAESWGGRRPRSARIVCNP